MMIEETPGAAKGMPLDSAEAVRAEIGAMERMRELAQAQRSAAARDDLEALDAAGQEMDALLRDCSRWRRARESAAAALDATAATRLRTAAQAFVDELSINRRVFREAIAGVNERAANLYRPASALYGRPETARGGGMAR